MRREILYSDVGDVEYEADNEEDMKKSSECSLVADVSHDDTDCLLEIFPDL